MSTSETILSTTAPTEPVRIVIFPTNLRTSRDTFGRTYTFPYWYTLGKEDNLTALPRPYYIRTAEQLGLTDDFVKSVHDRQNLCWETSYHALDTAGRKRLGEDIRSIRQIMAAWYRRYHALAAAGFEP